MFKKIGIAAVALAVAATAVFAGSHAGPFDSAITARKSHMQLNQHNLGILGAMAQSKMEYNADAAQAAADNLVSLSALNQGSYWPQGSDAGSNEGTRALAAIWTDYPDILSKVEALDTANAAMQIAAGESLEALQGAMGGVGRACGACHEAYRQSR